MIKSPAWHCFVWECLTSYLTLLMGRWSGQRRVGISLQKNSRMQSTDMLSWAASRRNHPASRSVGRGSGRGGSICATDLPSIALRQTPPGSYRVRPPRCPRCAGRCAYTVFAEIAIMQRRKFRHSQRSLVLAYKCVRNSGYREKPLGTA